MLRCVYRNWICNNFDCICIFIGCWLWSISEQIHKLRQECQETSFCPFSCLHNLHEFRSNLLKTYCVQQIHSILVSLWRTSFIERLHLFYEYFDSTPSFKHYQLPFFCCLSNYIDAPKTLRCCKNIKDQRDFILWAIFCV